MRCYSTGQCVSWQSNTMLWCFWTNATLLVSWAKQEGMIYVSRYKCDVINKGRLLLHDVIKYDGLITTQMMMTSSTKEDCCSGCHQAWWLNSYANDDIISSDVISFKKNSVVVRCGVHISGDSGRTVSLSELFPWGFPITLYDYKYSLTCFCYCPCCVENWELFIKNLNQWECATPMWFLLPSSREGIKAKSRSEMEWNRK